VQSPNTPVLPNKSGDVLHWRKLHGAASSLSISALSQQDKPVIYVCSDAQHMPAVAKELAFFLGSDEHIFTFPDWECLPYDRVSPHPDITSQRLLALHRLPDLKQGVLIIPITALIQRLAPTNYIAAHTFNLRINDELDTERFRQRLIDAGYYSVDQVMSPGEFAIRGGIVDVFPSGMKSPFRLDLFDTSIETIRLFDPETFVPPSKAMRKNRWCTVKSAKVLHQRVVNFICHCSLNKPIHCLISFPTIAPLYLKKA